MNAFKNFFGNDDSKEEIQKKGMEGIIYYKNGNFHAAVRSFEEYFKMKGKGKFPDLDSDDGIMLLNLGLSKQYSNDWNGAISIYDIITEKNKSWSEPYFVKSICFYKLGNTAQAKKNWEIAKNLGNSVAQGHFETEIIKFN